MEVLLGVSRALCLASQEYLALSSSEVGIIRILLRVVFIVKVFFPLGISTVSVESSRDSEKREKINVRIEFTSFPNKSQRG